MTKLRIADRVVTIKDGRVSCSDVMIRDLVKAVLVMVRLRRGYDPDPEYSAVEWLRKNAKAKLLSRTEEGDELPPGAVY